MLYKNTATLFKFPAVLSSCPLQLCSPAVRLGSIKHGARVLNGKIAFLENGSGKRTKWYQITTTPNSFLDSFEKTPMEGAADGDSNLLDEAAVADRIRRSSRERRELREITSTGMYVRR